MHVVLQPDSQQTPSTQLPLVHSTGSAHVEPFAFWPTQAVPEQ
jgi:hypothetical protein